MIAVVWPRGTGVYTIKVMEFERGGSGSFYDPTITAIVFNEVNLRNDVMRCLWLTLPTKAGVLRRILRQ